MRFVRDLSKVSIIVYFKLREHEMCTRTHFDRVFRAKFAFVNSLASQVRIYCNFLCTNSWLSCTTLGLSLQT